MILIIDNDREGREALRRLLTRVGYRAESVANGQEALDYLRAVSPRLVILDITDPLGNGLDILREIRRDDAMTSLPVVVRAFVGNPDDLHEADRLGIHGQLPPGDDDFIGLLSRIAQVFEPTPLTAPGLPTMATK